MYGFLLSSLQGLTFISLSLSLRSVTKAAVAVAPRRFELTGISLRRDRQRICHTLRDNNPPPTSLIHFYCAGLGVK